MHQTIIVDADIINCRGESQSAVKLLHWPRDSSQIFVVLGEVLQRHVPTNGTWQHTMHHTTSDNHVNVQSSCWTECTGQIAGYVQKQMEENAV